MNPEGLYYQRPQTIFKIFILFERISGWNIYPTGVNILAKESMGKIGIICFKWIIRFAGDFELWMRFFKYADQFITPALIGAFRMRRVRFRKSILHLISGM